MNSRRIELYLNTETGRIVYGFEPYNEITRPDELPQIYNGETVVLCVNCIDSTGQPVALNAADTFEAAVDNNFLHTDDLMAYSGADQVDIAGDWDQIDRAAGRFSVRIDAATTGFAEKIGSAGQISAMLEIKRYTSGGAGFSVICQDNIVARNTVLDGEGSPESADPEYYTASQTDALLGSYATTAEVNTALLPYAKTSDVNSAIAAAQNAAAATYLPFTGGNITGDLTVGNNPVTALPAGTVAGTLYVGANRELTTIAAALDHILQSSNGMDKVWNILLDPGEYTFSGTIAGLNLSFAPVSGSYSANCSITGDGITMESSRVTFTSLHFTATANASTVLSAQNVCVIQCSDCVFDCSSNTNAGVNAFNISGASYGSIDDCTFYAGNVASQTYARANSQSYLVIRGTAFVGTGAGIAVRASYGGVVAINGTTSTVSDMSRAIYAESRACVITGGGTKFTATNVTTYAAPALNTVGNNQAFIN